MRAQLMTIECDSAMRRSLLVKIVARLVLCGSGVVLSMSASGQIPSTTGALPLSLAMDAATETIRVCEAKGFRVNVAIVDPDGVIKLQARGDGSPIHSQGFSFRKAYTIMSMGPMIGADTNSALIKMITGFSPGLPATASSGTSNLLFLPGSVLVKQNGQAIAAIGVSGAPKSADDEVCAQAGVDKIKSRLIDTTQN
ncbi:MULTISPECIES: GlcG/HbpS family heme-binding protein [Paraburkholderia]